MIQVKKRTKIVIIKKILQRKKVNKINQNKIQVLKNKIIIPKNKIQLPKNKIQVQIKRKIII
jgi:hypothetical protein